jgi:hypothetical protein
LGIRYKSQTYRRAFISLSREFVGYAQDAKIDHTDPAHFIHWLQDVKRYVVGPDTWRLYRNAVASTMEINPEKWADSELQKQVTCLRKLKGQTNAEARSITGRPKGGSKVVTLKPSQMSELSAALKNGKHQYGPMTLAWFKACLITGARPNEWGEAQIIKVKSEECLEIKNLKIINYDDPVLSHSRETQKTKDSSGRALFQYRTIPLSQFSEDERKFIVDWVLAYKGIIAGIQEVNRSTVEEAQKSAFEKARRTMHAVSKYVSDLKGKNITLYTARHMFRTRNKTALLQNGYTEEQASLWLAILMGHGSTKSNYAYGTESEVGNSAESAVGIDSLGEEKAALARQILTRYS